MNKKLNLPDWAEHLPEMEGQLPYAVGLSLLNELSNSRNKLEEVEKIYLDFTDEVNERMDAIIEKINEIEDFQNFVKTQDAKRKEEQDAN